MQDKCAIGPRVCVYGPTGSGKTTLGRVLAERLGVPLIDLDTIFWLLNWTPKPEEQFRDDVQAAVAAHPDGWVCAGNYSRIQSLVLSDADTVLWLRLPFRVSFWRLFKRTVSRAASRKALWDGNENRESWRQSFFSKDSILLYAVTSRKTHVQHINAVLQNVPHRAEVRVLRSARAVRKLVEELEAAGRE